MNKIILCASLVVTSCLLCACDDEEQGYVPSRQANVTVTRSSTVATTSTKSESSNINPHVSESSATSSTSNSVKIVDVADNLDIVTNVNETAQDNDFVLEIDSLDLDITTSMEETQSPQEQTLEQALFNNDMPKVASILNESTPYELVDGAVRGELDVTTDNMGIVYPVQVSAVSVENSESDTLQEFSRKLALDVASSLNDNNGEYLVESDAFVTNGFYIQFVISFENETFPIEYRVDNNVLKTNNEKNLLSSNN